MPLIYGIDPGLEKSGIVGWNGKRVVAPEMLPNETLLRMLRMQERHDPKVRQFAIEMIVSFGKPVGRDVMHTIVAIGAFKEAIESRGGIAQLIDRPQVKLHICGQTVAKDSWIVQALKDRFGEKGTKAKPNPITHSLTAHLWQAFAVAVTAYDKANGKSR